MMSFVKVTLSNVQVRTVQIHLNDGGLPMASVNISYSALEMEVCDMDEEGNAGAKTKMGFDFGTGKVL